jgi:hypothetical protein
MLGVLLNRQVRSRSAAAIATQLRQLAAPDPPRKA